MFLPGESHGQWSLVGYCPWGCRVNFLEQISSLSHSIVFLYFFALFTYGFLISPCYSLELCIQEGQVVGPDRGGQLQP